MPDAEHGRLNMATYRRIDGKIVSVVFDLKFHNGKRGDGKKRRLINLLRALDLLLVHDMEVE